MALFYVQELLITSIVFDSQIIIPVKKISKSDYMCDTKFHLDQILEMFEPEICVGVIIVSGSCSLYYNMYKTGNHIERVLIKQNKIQLQKRQKKGGQSAQRIGRIRDEKENGYIKSVAEKSIELFARDDQCKGIIVAGPAEIKYKLVENELFQDFFKEKIFEIITTSEINETTILSIPFPKYESEECKRSVQSIIELIRNADDKLCFGNDIYHELTNCSIEYLCIDYSIDKKIIDHINEINVGNAKIYLCNILSKTNINMIGVKYY